jgi:hypothetical protein
MVAVTNEVLKCFFLLTQKYFPDPVNDSYKDRIGSFMHLYFTTTNNDTRYFKALAILVNKKYVI